MSLKKGQVKAWAIKFTAPNYGTVFDIITNSETVICTGGHTPRLFRYKHLAEAEIIRYWKPQDIPATAVRVIVVEGGA